MLFLPGSNVEDKSTGTTTARLVQNLMIIAAGFLTHKISLIAVTLQPQETEVVLTSATRRKGEVTD